MKLARFICLCTMLLASVSQARSLSQEEKKQDLEQLASMIKSSYGPLDLKRARFGIDVDALLADYVKKSATLSNLQFFHHINRFVAEFKDGHFGSKVQSRAISTLGFSADRVNGAVLIDQVIRAILPEARFNFERGDEIVEIDGKKVSEVVEELSGYFGMGNKESALRIASKMVGMRPVAIVPPRKGFSRVTIRRGTSDITETILLPWFTVGEVLEDETLQEWDAVPPDYDQLAIDDILADVPKPGTSFHCSGTTRTAIPRGATVLMKDPFVVYYHLTAKGNVGYLRIPHYNWGAKTTVRFEQYEWAIEQLEKNTVGLVIDQDHNCGGSVSFLEKMVGLFAEKDFKGLQFQFLATRAEYLTFKGVVDAEVKDTVTGRDWLGVLNLIKKAWGSRSRLSAKTTFHGERLLQPNRIHYTKPILILIDEMSGSGGDAFPAMMQGIGRAKLMGSRTMGAGGHVTGMPSLGFSANKINMTKSLFFRPDGIAVENNGAEPDIKYTPTRDDFMYQYRSYQKRYLAELEKMIP